jgi:hypothetical protein
VRLNHRYRRGLRRLELRRVRLIGDFRCRALELFTALLALLLIALTAAVFAEIFAVAPVTASAAASTPATAMFTLATSLSRLSLSRLMLLRWRCKPGFGLFSAPEVLDVVCV